MSAQTIRVPIKAWYGDEETDLAFAQSWDVEECRMRGHDTPVLSDEQMREALAHPMGTQPLREMAQGKKQVVILFDDLTRPAPTSQILPAVLDELAEAGIADDQIRFVTAYANHAAMSQEDFVKKLGQDVVRRFRIYNHNPYEHLVDLGKTTRGTPVLINQEVMACDLKIAIGGLIPHLGAGFGGGAKMVLPGVAGIKSAHYNHSVIGNLGGDRSATGHRTSLGKIEGNDLRADIEEAVGKVGLDMKIDLLVNHRRQVVGVFAGDFITQHRAGVEKAKELYATRMVRNSDIVVTNTYPIENQAIKAMWPAVHCLREGGTAVVVAHSVEGQALHYLVGRFGTNYGGKLWALPSRPLIPQAKRIIVCSAYLSQTDLDMFGPRDQVVACATWGEVLLQLMDEYPDQAKVAVYPYSAIQYPEGE